MSKVTPDIEGGEVDLRHSTGSEVDVPTSSAASSSTSTSTTSRPTVSMPVKETVSAPSQSIQAVLASPPPPPPTSATRPATTTATAAVVPTSTPTTPSSPSPSPSPFPIPVPSVTTQRLPPPTHRAPPPPAPGSPGRGRGGIAIAPPGSPGRGRGRRQPLAPPRPTRSGTVSGTSSTAAAVPPQPRRALPPVPAKPDHISTASITVGPPRVPQKPPGLGASQPAARPHRIAGPLSLGSSVPPTRPVLPPKKLLPERPPRTNRPVSALPSTMAAASAPSSVPSPSPSPSPSPTSTARTPPNTAATTASNMSKPLPKPPTAVKQLLRRRNSAPGVFCIVAPPPVKPRPRRTFSDPTFSKDNYFAAHKKVLSEIEQLRSKQHQIQAQQASNRMPPSSWTAGRASVSPSTKRGIVLKSRKTLLHGRSPVKFGSSHHLVTILREKERETERESQTNKLIHTSFRYRQGIRDCQQDAGG